jgi:hypothetical protein
LAAGNGIDPTIVGDLLMKAQVESALERSGIDDQTMRSAWERIEAAYEDAGRW